jgi:hypothetical protein
MNDRYLRGVLTVIAFALCWIAVQLTVREARAADLPPGTPSVQIVAPTKHSPSGVEAVAVYCINCAEKR